MPAVFGINNDGLNLAVNLLILFLVVIWLALIYWTYADARRRIADPMLVGCATAAALFPFVGTIVYMIVRPPEYLEDVRERELEMQAAEARLHGARATLCPHCDHEVEKDFLRCPSCLRRLKDAVRHLRQAARPALEDLPVLRGRGPRARASRSSAAAAASGGGGRGRERPAADAERAPPHGSVRPPRPDQRPATAHGSREPAEPAARASAGLRQAGTTPAARAAGRARRGRAARARAARPSGRAARASNPSTEGAQSVDRTLILVKPDAFERGLTGEIIARFERKGLKIAALKHMTVARETGRDSTTPSTASARSSASWSTSSPAARWSRWCSRATRPSRPPAS